LIGRQHSETGCDDHTITEEMAMDMELDPPEPNNELTTTEGTSSLDLVLARNLDRMSQIYNVELQPGAIRVWQRAMAGQSPRLVEWAFEEYFKTGKFPAKPADIYMLIRQHQETPRHDDKQFRPCGKCEFGWIRVYEGMTVGTVLGRRPVDPKVGAVKRCDCFLQWAAQRKAAA
jgi:hypothetical protein